MGDGKALQAGTSHNLGQHFATAYGIEFLDKNQQRALPWSTSWGTSTRMIGGLIMTHGDDAGLDPAPAGRALPGGDRAHPAAQGRRERGGAAARRARWRPRLRAAGVRVHLDDRDTQQPGFKYADWEMRGVPLRLEIGPKDIEKDQCVLVRRDTREKAFVPLAGLEADVRGAARRHPARPARARARSSWPTTPRTPRRYDEFKQVMADKRGFIVAGWCGERRLRGAHQGGDEGHGARHPDRRRGPARGLRALRRAVAARGLLRAGVLTTIAAVGRRCLGPSRRRPAARRPAAVPRRPSARSAGAAARRGRARERMVARADRGARRARPAHPGRDAQGAAARVRPRGVRAPRPTTTTRCPSATARRSRSRTSSRS